MGVISNKLQIEQEPQTTPGSGVIGRMVQNQPDPKQADPSIFSSGPVGSFPVVKQLNQFGVGLGTGIAKAGLGIGQTFLKGANVISNKLSDTFGANVPKDQYNPLIQGISDIKQNVLEKPYQKELSTVSGKVGDIAGSSAPFIATSPAITGAQQFTAGLTKGTPYLIRLLGQVAPEAIGSGATQYAASGGDAQSAKNVGIVSGVLSTFTHVGSDVFRKLIPQDLKTNVAKSLNINGKISLKDANPNGKVDDAVEAYTTISRLAPDMEVVDKNGVKHVFNPAKADFVEMPQALYQAKNKVYEAYTKVAQEAGDQGVQFTAKDFYKVIDDLNKYNGKGYTPAYSSKAGQVTEALQRFITTNKQGGKYFSNTSPLEIQQLIENINIDVNPLSDKAGAKVAGEASRMLRDILDAKIESGTGAQYQVLRDSYAQLKSIETPILNAYKKALRQSGFASDVIDGISVVDSLQGILTNSPNETIRGGLIAGVKKAIQYLRDPEVNMRRAFQLINEGPGPGTAAQRFAGPALENTGAFKAGQELQTGIKDYAKNPRFGMSIAEDTASGLSPANIAKKVDGYDLGLMRGYLKSDGINSYMKIEPILKKIGIDILPDATQKRFLQEVINESTKSVPVKSLSRTTASTFTKGVAGRFTGSVSSKGALNNVTRGIETYDNLIKSGDATPSSIYKDVKNKIYSNQHADWAISDAVGAVKGVSTQLGDKLSKILEPIRSSLTPEKLVSAVKSVIK